MSDVETKIIKDVFLDLSALTYQRPLLLGEAPKDGATIAFPAWLGKEVPQSTTELLDLAFGENKKRKQYQAENQRRQLQDKFDIENVITKAQTKNKGGSDFDHTTARDILQSEIIKAMHHNPDSDDSTPKFYGRFVIIFGRAGEALARTSSLISGCGSWKEDQAGFTAERSKHRVAHHDVVVMSGDKYAKCITRFLWVFHPQHLYRNGKSKDSKISLEISYKRAVIKKLLEAGLEDRIFEHVFADVEIIYSDTLSNNLLKIAA